MLILALFLYAILGVVAGVLAGLLGISGGVIAVPALFVIFKILGLPQAHLMHLAIGTSLASMIFNSLSSAWYHNKKGAVLWKTVKEMTIGIIIGSIIGALIADSLSGIILEMLFGLFACLLGVHLLRNKKPKTHASLPSAGILNLIGSGIGAISNILGIGGGSMSVPVLLHYRVPETKAIGTSAALGVLITTLGAISYLGFGYTQTYCRGCIGYLYLPAFLVIGIVSFFAAPYGAKLAHIMPAPLLRKIFAYSLIVIGLLMLFL